MKTLLSFLALLASTGVGMANITISSPLTNGGAAYPLITTDQIGGSDHAAGDINKLYGGNIVTNNFSSATQPLLFDSSAFANKTVYGQLQAAMTKPWIFLYCAPYLQSGVREGQSNVVAWVTNMKTNTATLAAMTNAGGQMAVYFDVSWGQENASNTSFKIARDWSLLQWNTNLWSLGFPWMMDFLHTNGFKAVVQVYATTNLLPTGADEFICSPQGGNSLQAWTNNAGLTWPTNGSGPYVVCFDSGNMAKYVATLLAWGVDGVSVSDGVDGDQSPPQFDQINSQVANACMTVTWPNSAQLGTGIPYPGYANVNTNNYNFSVTSHSTLSTLYWMGKTMMFMAFEDSSGVGPFTEGYRTAGSHAAVFYDNTSQGRGDAGLRCIARDFPNMAKAGPYISWMGFTDTPSLDAIALSHGLLFSGWFGESLLGSGAVAFSNIITSPEWLAIEYDPLQLMPKMIVDNGTNNGSVWATKLVDGNYAVGIFIGPNAAFTNTVTWSMLGFPTNAYVDVSYIQPVGAPIDQGIFQNSYTHALPNNVAVLEKFTLLPFRGDYSGTFAATNLTSVGSSPGQIATATSTGVAWSNAPAGGGTNGTGVTHGSYTSATTNGTVVAVDVNVPALTNALGFFAAVPAAGGNASTNVAQNWPAAQQLINPANTIVGNGSWLTFTNTIVTTNGTLNMPLGGAAFMAGDITGQTWTNYWNLVESGGFSTSYPGMGYIVSRTLTGDLGMEVFGDWSILNQNPTFTDGYNSFDAQPIAIGGTNQNHLNSFQARPIWDSKGNLFNLSGFMFEPVLLTNSNIGTVIGSSLLDVQNRGGGIVTNDFGINIASVSAGKTNVGIYIGNVAGSGPNNYAIQSASPASVLFGGAVFTADGNNYYQNIYYDSGWKYRGNGGGFSFGTSGGSPFQFFVYPNNVSGSGTPASSTQVYSIDLVSAGLTLNGPLTSTHNILITDGTSVGYNLSYNSGWKYLGNGAAELDFVNGSTFQCYYAPVNSSGANAAATPSIFESVDLTTGNVTFNGTVTNANLVVVGNATVTGTINGNGNALTYTGTNGSGSFANGNLIGFTNSAGVSNWVNTATGDRGTTGAESANSFIGNGNSMTFSNAQTSLAGPMMTTNAAGQLAPSYNGGGLTNLNGTVSGGNVTGTFTNGNLNLNASGGSSNTNIANIETYGAVGDGNTDSAAAITAAIASGLPVYIPKGTFLVSSTVHLPAGVTIFGDGGNESIIQSKTTIHCVDVVGSNTVIKSIGFIGANSSPSSSGAVGIYVSTNFSGGLISDCSFFGLTIGIYIYNIASMSHHPSLISNPRVESCYYGIYSDVSGEYIQLVNPSIYACQWGLTILGGNFNSVGGAIDNCINGIFLNTGANDSHGRITGMLINHNSYPVVTTNIVNGFDFDSVNIYTGTNVISGTGVRFDNCTLDLDATIYYSPVGCVFNNTKLPNGYANTEAFSNSCEVLRINDQNMDGSSPPFSVKFNGTNVFNVSKQGGFLQTNLAVFASTPVNGVSGQPADAASVVITPGTWRVEVSGVITRNSSTYGSSFYNEIGISSTPGNAFPEEFVHGTTGVLLLPNPAVADYVSLNCCIPSMTTTTNRTLYMKFIGGTFSGGPPTLIDGYINVTRIAQ